MDSPHISGFVLRFFRGIVRRYFRKHFSAVRVSRQSNLTALQDERLILFANHCSWWDPMTLVLLGERFMAGRNHYAPMDAASLERYSILRRIGIFGVEMNTARGAAKFLRTGLTILARGGVLWVTPQGRFADTRERPLVFKPGLAALAARVGDGCTVQPMAIEYVFWDERLPEVLVHFGQPVSVHGQTAEELDRCFRAALVDAMEELKLLSMARDSSAFQVIQVGRVGTGGMYEFGQRIVARLRGRTYQAAHTAAQGLRPEERV